MEAVSGYESHALMNGRASYPHNVKGAVHAFAEVLDTAEIKGYVLESRKSCLAEQVRRGCPEKRVANFLDWDGALVALPDMESRLRRIFAPVLPIGAARPKHKQSLKGPPAVSSASVPLASIEVAGGAVTPRYQDVPKGEV